MKPLILINTLVILLFAAGAAAQVSDTPILDADEQRIRERYEQALRRSPFQDQTFERVYERYLTADGVDAWVTALETEVRENPDDSAPLVLLARIHERRFATDKAIEYFERARTAGETRPELDLMLGELYYGAGRDDEAVELLVPALENMPDSDDRSRVVRILGNVYFRQGKRDEAIDVWKRLIDGRVVDEFAYVELAEIYEDNRMWDDAIATYRELVKAAANDPYRQCRALRSIGRCHEQNEAYPEAITAYEEALGLVAPGNWLFEDLKLRLVSVYENLGDLEGLAAYLRERIAGAPGDVEFRALLGETYLRMKRYGDAEAEYTAILERDPGRIATYERLIDLHERANDKEKVVETYEKLIAAYPAEPDYLRRLGQFQLLNGDAERAKETWRRSLAAGRTPERLARLASWYDEFDFLEDAAETYEEAIAAKPNREWSYQLASTYVAMNRTDDARRTWLSIVEGDAATSGEYAEVGAILETHGFDDDARELYEKAIGLAPDNFEFQYSLAKLLLRQEEYDSALDVFDRLAEQDENDYFQERGERGRLDVYAGQGVLDEKRHEWEQLLEREPDSPEMLIRLARLYERIGNRAGALDLYRKCVELAPDDPEYLGLLASAYRRERQFQQAAETLDTLIEIDPNRAGGYYRELLDVYLSQQRQAEAVETAKRIVEMAPSDPEARIDLAHVLSRYQQYDEAHLQYRHALQLAPNEPDYYRMYGDALADRQEWGEAQEIYRKMLDVSESDDARLMAVEKLAGVYLRQEQSDDLVEEFRTRVRNTPKRFAAYEELAAIYRAGGEFQKAVDVLEEGYAAVDDKNAVLRTLIRATYDVQDYTRMVKYYDALVAGSGQTTPLELERLAHVHVLLGEMDEAQALWDRIVEENPDDARVLESLARSIRNEGLLEEALEVKALALDVDPHDYVMRFEYAQDLNYAGLSDRAMEEYYRILELGPGEEEEAAAARPGAGVQPTALHSSQQVIYRSAGGQVRAVMRPNTNVYTGGPWRGTFDEFRVNVVRALAAQARRSGVVESMVERFEERAEAEPEYLDRKRDLLNAYSEVDRVEDAIAAAETLIASAPDDVEFLERLAGLHLRVNQTAKAIERYERLVELDPDRRQTVWPQLVSLHLKEGNEEAADEYLAKLQDEFAGNFGILRQAGDAMIRGGDVENAIAYFEKIQETNESYERMLRPNLAELYYRKGERGEAARIWEAIVFDHEAPVQSPDANQRIYVPTAQHAARQRRGGGIYAMQNQSVFTRLQDNRLQGMGRLIETNSSELKTIEERLRARAYEYFAAIDPKKKAEAWDYAKILVSYLVHKNRLEEALDYLEAAKKDGADGVEFYNMLLYVHEGLEQYDEMDRIYTELVHTYPERRQEVLQARARWAVTANRFDAAKDLIAELDEGALPAPQRMQLVQVMRQAQEYDLALELMEESLETHANDPQHLMLLAQVYGDKREYDKAIEVGLKAWELSGQPQQRTVGARTRTAPNVNRALITQLFHYYQAQSRGEDFIALLEDRIEKQPGAAERYFELAALHNSNNDPAKAADVMDRLVRIRPNDHTAQLQRAELLFQLDRTDEAVEAYERLVARSPSMLRQVAFRLRDAYERLGQEDKLLALEERMIARSQNSDEVFELGRQYQRRGELEKAVRLFERAVDMNPNQFWYYGQIAQAYESLGEYAKAARSYENLLSSNVARGQGFVDHNSMGRYAALKAKVGELEELKQSNERDLEAGGADRDELGMAIQIAVLERRYDDVHAHAVELRDSYNDPTGFAMLFRLAELSGRVEDAVQVLEDRRADQGYAGIETAAKLYLMEGDTEKAVSTLEGYAQAYGGNYGYVQVVQRLAEYGLWEEAEAYYYAHRDELNRTSYDDDLDRIAVEGHIIGKAFPKLLEGPPPVEYTPRMQSIIQAIVRIEGDDSPRAISFLERARRGKRNVDEVLTKLAEAYERAEKWDAAIEVRKELVERDSDRANWRADLANAQIRAGREVEALTQYRAWFEKNESYHAARAYMNLLMETRRFREFEAMTEKAIALADAGDMDRIRIEAARRRGEMGDVHAERELLESLAKESKAVNWRREHFRHLLDRGYESMAYAEFNDETEGGRIDRDSFGHPNFIPMMLRQGNVEELAQTYWDTMRLDQNWNQVSTVTQQIREAERHGYGGHLARRIEQMIRAGDQSRVAPLQALASQYEQLGQPADAARMYDALRALKPLDWDLALPHAVKLNEIGRHEEAIEVLEAVEVFTDPAMEIEAAKELAAAHYRAGRRERAVGVVNEKLDWVSSEKRNAVLASLFLRLEEYDKALEYIEQAGLYQQLDDELVYGRAQCYAKAGRNDDAFALWEQHRYARAFRQFHDWLMKEKLYACAAPILERIVETNYGRADIYQHLIAATYESGDTTKHADQYLSGINRVAPSNQRQIEWGYGRFLADQELIEETLALAAERQEPVLERAAMSGLIHLANVGNEPQVQALASRIDPAALTDLQACLRAGDALIRIDDLEDARTFLAQGASLADASASDRLALARDLVLAGDYGRAGEVFDRVLKEKPSVAFTEPVVLEAYGKSGRPEAVETLQKRLQELTPFESHHRYYKVFAEYYQNPSESALAALESLVDAPNLATHHLNHLAKELEDAGRFAGAARAYDRLSAGGHTVLGADANAVSNWARAGEWEKALEAYARLMPIRDHEESKALAALKEHVTKEALPAVEKFVASFGATYPQRESVSDLAGLYGELAERFGVPVDLREWAVSAGVSGRELDETAQWAGLVEAWKFSKLYDCNDAEAMTAPPPDEIWTAVEENRFEAESNGTTTLGLVDVAESLGFDEEQNNDKAVYAWTAVERDEAGPAVLSAGSDGWMRVWVNGKEVHRAISYRPVALDQDRALVDLKKGKNTIVVKLRRSAGPWRFCLGFLDGPLGEERIEEPIIEAAA